MASSAKNAASTNHASGGERREGGFLREERSFDKPRFGGERREGGFQREERNFDKPRFGDKPREGGFQRDAAPARTLFGKGEAREPGQGFGKQGGGDKVGRTPFVKAQPRTLKDGEFALFASCPRGWKNCWVKKSPCKAAPSCS